MTNAEIHALDLEDMSQTAWTYIIIVQTLLCEENSIRITRCMNTWAINERIRPVSNVEFCMHRIRFTLDSTAIVKFDVCFKRGI